MRKLLLVVLSLIFIAMPFTKVEGAPDDNITVHYFYSEHCGICQRTSLFFENELMDEYPDVEFIKYDTDSFYGNKMFVDAYKMFGLDLKQAGTPLIIVGNYVFPGFSEESEDQIRRVLNYYQKNFYNDTFGVYTGIAIEQEGDDQIYELINDVNVPFWGKVNLVEGSLFGVTFMLGVADGFNPCAMWVLIFLISIMLTMKDRKRMWVLGLTFIGTSAFIYFLFMAAWLNVALIFTDSRLIQILIGLFASGMGIVSLYNYFQNKGKEKISCDVTNSNQKRKITDRIIKYTKEKNLIIALFGIILLAVSVNAIELVCSLGLPVIYTNFLTMADLSKPTYYMYILLYTFFFMLDDIIVFSIAMFTMKLTSSTTKFTKLSKIIGGLIMLLIGIGLIFFPSVML